MGTKGLRDSLYWMLHTKDFKQTGLTEYTYVDNESSEQLPGLTSHIWLDNDNWHIDFCFMTETNEEADLDLISITLYEDGVKKEEVLVSNEQ